MTHAAPGLIGGSMEYFGQVDGRGALSLQRKQLRFSAGEILAMEAVWRCYPVIGMRRGIKVYGLIDHREGRRSGLNSSRFRFAFGVRVLLEIGICYDQR